MRATSRTEATRYVAASRKLSGSFLSARRAHEAIHDLDGWRPEHPHLRFVSLLVAPYLSGASRPVLAVVVEGEVPENRFQMSTNVFTLKYRALETFFGGLEHYIGAPSPDILHAMEREHSSEEPFNSHVRPRSRIRDRLTGHVLFSREILTAPARTQMWQNVFGTTPRDEWLYVVTMEVGTRPDRCRDATPQRFEWKLEDFCQADAARRAKLLREEVIGLRLYTGPMYVHYNNRVLRAARQGYYVTTIHCINSAIVKLGKNQKAVRVYRGMSGGMLPEEFNQPGEMGTRGGVEAAFMSTTTDRSVAMEYASRDDSVPSIVFQIRMGMIDKGADVSWVSQFPAEAESALASI